ETEEHGSLVLIWLYRLYPSLLDAIIIIQPKTVIRWHRRGFRAYRRWKSRQVGGRPRIDSEMRALIRQISHENPLWDAPRIHGELLMLGFEVAESTVGRYMARRRWPPSQGWKTFLRNHTATSRVCGASRLPTVIGTKRTGRQSLPASIESEIGSPG
ncbi:MAG TPA: hypothetical protein VFO27_11815, partial [Bryobacteraceae bacterium]|nr:hypothetical protein [Bryobacteraceae bacterium]